MLRTLLIAIYTLTNLASGVIIQYTLVKQLGWLNFEGGILFLALWVMSIVAFGMFMFNATHTVGKK